MKEDILNSIKEVEHALKISKRALSETLSFNEAFWKRAVKYQEVLLAALKEQLNRLEGCEICNSNYKAISRYVGFYPKRAEIEIKDAVDGDVQIDIKCCPICGRKLRGGEDE